MPTVTKQSRLGAKRKTGSVIDRIAPIGFDQEEGIHILLYGKSGTGKTTLWATFPGPILAIICSGSKRPGELRSVNTPEYRKKIKSVSLNSSDEMRPLIEYIQRSEFGTVVLDHASGLQDLVLKEILGLDELPEQKSWGMATQQQYGQCTAMCKEILRQLLNLPCNVVVVAQEREFNAEGSESELITPTVGAAMTPSLTGWLNPACDYICQTCIRPRLLEKQTRVGKKTITTTSRGKGIDYCLRTAPHDVYTTKFRVPKGTVLPEYVVNPTYAKLVAIINGEDEAH